MSLPNYLTLSRFFFIPIYLLIYFSSFKNKIYLSFLVVVLAGITDIVDGYIARKKNQITDLGKMLDPLADKLFMMVIFLSFLVNGKIKFSQAFVLVLRDILMILVSTYLHLKKKVFFAANYLGKFTTFLYYISFVLLLFEVHNSKNFLWFTIFFSYFTMFFYSYRLLNFYNFKKVKRQYKQKQRLVKTI